MRASDEKFFRLINWNVGGAKFLELKERKNIPGEHVAKRGAENQESRESFKEKLDAALNQLIEAHRRPHILTLQEVIQFHKKGDHTKPKYGMTVPKGYEIFPFMLIDNRRHSHQGKWDKVRTSGEWDQHTFFAQGNAILVREDFKHQMFPVWSLPAAGVTYDEWLKSVSSQKRVAVEESKTLEEHVYIENGLYFGDRDTEPRGASVAHFVFTGGKGRPLDIFVVNTHFTTLMQEREGVPSKDKDASEVRNRQLNTVLYDVVSRYNLWRKHGYLIRREKVRRSKPESNNRNNPIWILAGDFNFTPNSEEYRRMIGHNFADLVPNQLTKAPGVGNNPTITVDYVFAGPLFESIDPDKISPTIIRNSVRVDKITKVSDHYPLMVEVPLEPMIR